MRTRLSIAIWTAVILVVVPAGLGLFFGGWWLVTGRGDWWQILLGFLAMAGFFLLVTVVGLRMMRRDNEHGAAADRIDLLISAFRSKRGA